MYVIMSETLYGIMHETMCGDVMHVCCHALCCIRP